MMKNDAHLYPRPDMAEFKAWIAERQPWQEHPERRSNEVFWGNSTVEGLSGYGFENKRLGVTAYLANGEPMDPSHQKVLFPVFIQVDELYRLYRSLQP